MCFLSLEFFLISWIGSVRKSLGVRLCLLDLSRCGRGLQLKILWINGFAGLNFFRCFMRSRTTPAASRLQPSGCQVPFALQCSDQNHFVRSWDIWDCLWYFNTNTNANFVHEPKQWDCFWNLTAAQFLFSCLNFEVPLRDDPSVWHCWHSGSCFHCKFMRVWWLVLYLLNSESTTQDSKDGLEPRTCLPDPAQSRFFGKCTTWTALFFSGCKILDCPLLHWSCLSDRLWSGYYSNKFFSESRVLWWMQSFCASPLELLIVVAGLHTPKSCRSLGRADNTGHFAASNIFVYLLGKRGQSVHVSMPTHVVGDCRRTKVLAALLFSEYALLETLQRWQVKFLEHEARVTRANLHPPWSHSSMELFST